MLEGIARRPLAVPDDADRLARLKAALADRYRVERELGHGGMAAVYLAEDLKHHRRVAIKVLRPELAAALGPERFLREVQITARFSHPHILPLLDSGEVKGFLYYVMPYVEGESLRDRLNREKQLPLDDVFQLAREVADALTYAHSRDVVHRDIKPENILLQSGHAVVADFGIAKALTAAGGDRLTGTGIALGTPAYMSPEQASGEQHVDGRSDTYSLACVVYEMLSGTPPFTGATAQAVMARHSLDPVPSLKTVRAAVPDSVEQAVARGMAKVPAERFATVAQFVEALSAPGGARPRARWRLALVPAAGLAVAGLLVEQFLGRHGPHVIAPASVIAVLPLAPSVPDSTLTRLGRDLVLTISATLDGLGDIRTIDAHTILAQLPDTGAMYSLAMGRALGQRLGAGSVMQGSLVHVGTRVQLDFGLYTSDSGLAVARASVTGSPDSLAALTDAVTRALLVQVWRRGEAPTPSVEVALRTRSMGALREFLEGEHALIENRFHDAELAYGRAIANDSTFWLAYSRHGYARGWQGLDVDTGVTHVAQVHRLELPERDRLFVESGMMRPDSLTAGIARARLLTQRFPDDWLGWMNYGDYLVHWAPLVGHTRAEARVALERAVELNPRLVPAWEHLSWMYFQDHDTAGCTRALRALQHLNASLALGATQGWDEMLELRLLDRLQRGDSAGSQVLMDSVVRSIPRNREAITPLTLPYGYGFPRAQIEINRRVLRNGLAPDAADYRRLILAASWVARGAWDSALVAIDDYVRHTRDDAAPVRAYRLAVLGVWLGASDVAEANKRRAAAAKAASGLGTDQQALIAWLDGILAVAQKDSGALQVARRTIGRLPADRNPGWEGSLDAFELSLTGNVRQAGAILAAQEWRRSERDDQIFGTGELNAIDRLAASEWLIVAGDTAQAARLLTWHEAYWPVSSIFMPAGLIYFKRAQIEDRNGNVADAREYYQQFLMRYDMPVPRHRHLVDEARAAMRRLGGQENGGTPSR